MYITILGHRISRKHNITKKKQSKIWIVLKKKSWQHAAVNRSSGRQRVPVALWSWLNTSCWIKQHGAFVSTLKWCESVKALCTLPFPAQGLMMKPCSMGWEWIYNPFYFSIDSSGVQMIQKIWTWPSLSPCSGRSFYHSWLCASVSAVIFAAMSFLSKMFDVLGQSVHTKE